MFHDSWYERDNISGKQIEYAIPMLVNLAENAFHVGGFNLFNTIYLGHIYISSLA